MIGISACLGGICCRYDASSQSIKELEALVKNGQAILICPEVLGYLPIPRNPAEIVGGDGFSVWDGTAKVVDLSGQDVTESFKSGAILAYKELKKLKISQVILKENSPSCGSQFIYDGTFSGMKKKGIGVASAYFILQGLEVLSDEEWSMRGTNYERNHKNI